MPEGKPASQWLASNDLGSFPWYEATLWSPLRPDEIARRLAERVAHQPQPWQVVPTFAGSSTPDAFRVWMRAPIGSRGGPVLLGRLKATPDGAYLDIRLRPHQVVTLGVFGFALLAFLAMLASFVYVGALCSFVVFVPGTMICGRLWWRFQYEGRLLLEMAEREVGATLARPHRPKSF